MNNSDSAKKGFRTFILTLSISLLVFSAIYYGLTTYTPQNTLDEKKVEMADVSRTEDVSVPKVEDKASSVQGAGDEETSSVKGISDKKTLFGEINDKKPQAKPQEVEVLAGVAPVRQTTQSTTSVPDTGLVEMTIGLALSLIFFVAAMTYNFMNPRKLALSKFERKVIGKSK